MGEGRRRPKVSHFAVATDLLHQTTFQFPIHWWWAQYQMRLGLLSPTLHCGSVWVQSLWTFGNLLWPEKSLFSGKYQTKISPHCFADKWPEIITLRVLEEVMHWPVTHSSFAFRPWPTFSLQRINVKSVFFHLCLINRNTFQRINSFKILMELLSSWAALPRFSSIIVMLL